MPNGILIVNKPAGWTSQDVVAKLRGVFHEKRVGHGGTLDPMATGVLPVFVGRATRAVEFFTSAEKEYEAGLRLGITTTTQDTTGTVLKTRPVELDRAALEAVLPRFLGKQQQLPPMYSAIKIGGKKLYELARQGKEVERTPREIEIFSLRLLDGENDLYRFSVHCSKGTYVRTLCHDLGQALGCGGCMESLLRTQAGCYTLAQSHTMEEIIAAEDPTAFLLPVDSLFADSPAVTVTAKQEKKIRNGAAISPWDRDGSFRLYGANGAFLALAEGKNGELKTIKSFFEVD